MKKLLLILSLICWPSLSYAVNVNIDGLVAATSVVGADLFECEQSSVNHKCTSTQVAAYIYGLATGDCVISGVGAVICTKTSGVAFTSAATTAIGTSGATIPLLSTANTWTLGQTFTAVPTFSAISGSIQCLHVNASGVLSGTGTDCGTGAGGVTSITGGIGITASASTGPVTISALVTARNNTGTTDTLISTDAGLVVTENNASPVTVGIAAAGGAGFLANTPFSVKNKGAGLVTIIPTTSTIDGAANVTLTQNQSIDFYSDGTNYITLPGRATGGTTSTIASGTQALGVGAIGPGACIAAVQSTATGTATTDVVTASFNGDPTAVTGYIPLTTGMLTVIVYPTLNTANFKVCNNTSASITPGAITLNWRVVR